MAELKGFSKRNIFYCRSFYLFYANSSVQQPVALKDADSEEAPVQQDVALNYDDSVQQVVGLNETHSNTISDHQDPILRHL